MLDDNRFYHSSSTFLWLLAPICKSITQPHPRPHPNPNPNPSHRCSKFPIQTQLHYHTRTPSTVATFKFRHRSLTV